MSHTILNVYNIYFYFGSNNVWECIATVINTISRDYLKVYNNWHVVVTR